MKLSFIFGLLFSLPVFASHFEVCRTTAKVVSIEEVSVFEKGSVSVPAGVQSSHPEEEYTFLKILTVKVLTAESEGSRNRCAQMIDQDYRVILDSKAVLEGVKADDVLNLTRTLKGGMTPFGLARGETWTQE